MSDFGYGILLFDWAAAETYSRLVVQTENAGKPRPMADLTIAATAMTHGLIVATLNTKAFTGIPGLRVEDWGLSQLETQINIWQNNCEPYFE